MKRLAVVTIMAGAVAVTAAGAGDILQQLRVGAADARTEVTRSIAHGSVDYHRVRDAFKAATPAVRAAMVEQVLIWAKAWVSSPQFAKEYASLRDQARPHQPEARPSIDEELKERRAQRAAELEETKRSIAEMPAEYRKSAEEGLKAAIETMKQLDTAEYRRMEREGLEAERQQEQEQYRDDLAQWEEDYPAEPRAMVRKRLTEFLEETAGVDYSAALVTRYGKQRFVKEEYESKPSNWKLAYRAGKEATEKARAFAKAWLAEL